MKQRRNGMPERPPFPTAIDNTMRSAWRACPTQFWWAYIRRKRLNVPQIHLHAGGAFAHALHAARQAFYLKGKTQQEAELVGVREFTQFYGDAETDTVKSWDRMVHAFLSYCGEYPFATDMIQPMVVGDKPMIEFSFALPLPIPHPQTGDPILYSGRSDMVGTYNNLNFVVDEKTTQRLGATWVDQWQLRSQFIGYVWACQQWGWPIAGAIVRGVCLYADRVAHAQAIVYHPEWKINRWYEQLVKDVNGMVEAWRADEYDIDWSDACNAYGGCAYKRLCELENPEPAVELDYVDNDWDPLL